MDIENIINVFEGIEVFFMAVGLLIVIIPVFLVKSIKFLRE